MTKFIRIAGNPKSGMAVLGDDGGIRTLANTDGAAWGISPPLWKQKFTAATMSLSNGGTSMTAVALDATIKFLTTLGNPQATWKEFAPPLPKDIVVAALAGDAANGFAAVDAAGKVYLVTPGAKPEWKAVAGPLPFSGAISAIVGDTKNGLVIVSDDDPSRLARSGSDCCSWTLLIQPAPVRVERVSGDAINGFIVYGEGQLYALLPGKELSWKPLPALSFRIAAMSGNPVDGVVALMEGADVVTYCKDVLKGGPWCVALGPMH